MPVWKHSLIAMPLPNVLSGHVYTFCAVSPSVFSKSRSLSGHYSMHAFFPPSLPLLPLEFKIDNLHQNSFPVGILYMKAHIGTSLLVFGTLHSNGYIFPFLLCFLLLFFSQLVVRPPQTAILLFCISFSWGWSCSLSPVQCHEPSSIVHQALYQI